MLGAWGLRGKHTSEKQSIHGRGGACFKEISGVVAASHGCWHEAPLGKDGGFCFSNAFAVALPRARALWGGAGRDTGEHYITHDTYLDGILFLLSF